MIYSFMRIILLYDLPIKTKKDKRVYANFRKYLINKGYIMLQYSVYSKLFSNRDSATKHIQILKTEIPQKGNIRILLLTEKQYSKMEIILGGRSFQEKKITKEPFMKI